MKAPGFWWRPPGLAATLLQPAAYVYGAVAGGRMARPGMRAPCPVICVGNVTVGGSGKTPAALAVASALRDLGRNPAFLTRGYGGSLPGPVQVDPARHAAAEVGDEPLLLARGGITVVARHRPAGASLAVELGADVVVMDDGLQNPSLRKDLALAVFDGAVGIGSGCVLPAGPLRAPMAAQWRRIDVVVVVGAGSAGDAIAAEAARRRLPLLRASLAPDSASAALSGCRVLAFAGIGRPAKFFESCERAGMEVVATRSFPDHHPYPPGELSELLDEAEQRALVPVTTEKDEVRLAGLAASEPRVELVRTLPVTLRFERPETLRAILVDLLAGFADQDGAPGSPRPRRLSTASGET